MLVEIIVVLAIAGSLAYMLKGKSESPDWRIFK